MVAKIKTTIGHLKKIVDLVCLEGKSEVGTGTEKLIKDFVCNVTPDGKMSIAAADKEVHFFCALETKVNVITPGEIIISDVEHFIGYLKTFNDKDEVTLSHEENGFIKIVRESPKKVVRFITTLKEHIEGYVPAKDINETWEVTPDFVKKGDKLLLDSIVQTTAQEINKIVLDSAAVNEQRYPFTLLEEDGNWLLKVEVGNSQLGVIKSLIPTTQIITKERINNVYEYGFDAVFSTLTGNVRLYTNPGMPLFIVQMNKDFKLHYMIVPIVEEA